MFMEKKTTARACANIALIKYWGKRDEELFLPTKSSLSVSLNELYTTTNVNIHKGDSDIILVNNQNFSESKNIVQFLDFFRKQHSIQDKYFIDSHNTFPTAAGLASSASGFAALSMALNQLHQLNLSKKDLSILARHGSGSACRSIYDGFVLWNKGKKKDGSDSYAEQIFEQSHWPEFRLIVLLLNESEKSISSRKAMKLTMESSPIYQDWITRSEARIAPMIEAIKNKNIDSVGAIAETDALEMHECMRAASPSISYFLPETITTINLVKSLRSSGIPCYVTIDAGPNVKLMTLDPFVDIIMAAIEKKTCFMKEGFKASFRGIICRM